MIIHHKKRRIPVILPALLIALGLMVQLGCSKTYIIGQDELIRAQKVLETESTVVVEAKAKAPSKLVPTRVVLHNYDYVYVAGMDESIHMGTPTDLSRAKSGQLKTSRKAPAFFWPGFGILLGTTIPLVLVATNMDPQQLDLMIPVYGPYNGGVDASRKVVSTCNSRTLGCVGKKTGYVFGAMFAFIVTAAQGIGFGLAVTGLVFYGTDSNNYDPDQLVVSPAMMGEGGMGAQLGFRF